MSTKTSNPKADELRAEIADLRKKIRLSESKEEIIVMSERIEFLVHQLKNVYRKDPVVVAVKDAKTIGDKMEAKLTSKNSGGRMGNRAVLI